MKLILFGKVDFDGFKMMNFGELLKMNIFEREELFGNFILFRIINNILGEVGCGKLILVMVVCIVIFIGGRFFKW